MTSGLGVGGFDLSGNGWVTQTSPVLGPQAKENTYRWATVTDDTPLEIQLDGDSLPLPLLPENLIEAGPPPIGSRVWVQLFGRRVIVLGVAGGLRDPALTALQAAVASEITTRAAADTALAAVNTAQDADIANLYANSLYRGAFAFGSVSVPGGSGSPSTLAVPSFGPLAGSTFVAYVSANTSVPGTTVLGVSWLNATSTGLDVVVTRTNATNTVVSWMVVGL